MPLKGCDPKTNRQLSVLESPGKADPSTRTHLIDLIVQFHDLHRLHQFLLEGAADPLPLSSFPAETDCV